MGSNAFSTILNTARSLDRNFGGTGADIVADPYISGYHFVSWTKLPTRLSEFISSGDGEKTSQQISSNAQIRTFLNGATLAVTPPGGTINKTEFTGLGNTKWAVPTSIDYGTSLTLKFLEFTHTPVLSIFHGWARLIRNYKTGLSELSENDDAYTKSEYTGTMLYWTTKPDGKTVEYSAAYSGLFPLKDPQDLFSGDLTAIDKLEIDIEFNVDWIWHEQWVNAECQRLADEYHSKNTSWRGGNTAGAGTDSSVSK